MIEGWHSICAKKSVCFSAPRKLLWGCCYTWAGYLMRYETENPPIQHCIFLLFENHQDKNFRAKNEMISNFSTFRQIWIFAPKIWYWLSTEQVLLILSTLNFGAKNEILSNFCSFLWTLNFRAKNVILSKFCLFCQLWI